MDTQKQKKMVFETVKELINYTFKYITKYKIQYANII